MKHLIVSNEKKKTLTVILSPVSIGFTDYLYERYNGERFFASGVLSGADYKEDIMPVLNGIVQKLNEVAGENLPAGMKFDIQDLFTMDEEEFKLITKNINKEGEWDKQFKINLSSKNATDTKKFLFKDLKGENPVPKVDGWKHNYAVEIEISGGYNEDKMEKYIYSIFHRGISVGLKETTFKENDDAWSGFDFEEPEEDLPF